MKMFYSVNTKGFYPEGNMEGYKSSGILPDDLKAISKDDYDLFFNPPEGFYGVFDEEGPRVEKLPEPDYVNLASLEKARLIAEATVDIAPLQDAVTLGDATEDEEARLKSLMSYRVALNRLDLNDAPNINWPTKP